MATKPATRTDVAKVLGRVAFGATAADLDTWAGKPYEDLVDDLLAVADLPVVPPLPDDARRVALQASDSTAEDARAWWLERMRTTPYPLLERLTLVWHGHFATGVRYPPLVGDLVRQNDTLRTHALGDVHDLVAAMTIDPAMLFWLNGHENATPHPNENYAREFFELFTLGTRPQVYTERDVREAARAFTGWIVGSAGTAQFVAARHDAKTKRVLGRTITNQGVNEYRALVDVALRQPAAARFLAFKLVANLAYVPSSTSEPLVKKVAATLARTWRTADAVRTLLLADEFRYGLGPRQLVRSPVEAFVHAAKALDVELDKDGTFVWYLQRMGHALFDPVDVSGWPLGRDWVTPVTALARYDAGLAFHERVAKAPTRVLDPLPEPGDLAGWARRLGVAAFGRNTSNAVKSHLRRTAKDGVDAQRAGVLTLLLSSPEWVVM
jgi:uncharacterized protein (DUF1800 family)